MACHKNSALAQLINEKYFRSAHTCRLNIKYELSKWPAIRKKWLEMYMEILIQFSSASDKKGGSDTEQAMLITCQHNSWNLETYEPHQGTHSAIGHLCHREEGLL